MDILNKVYNAIKVTNVRHELLSDNIANASTPKFKSKDLDSNQKGFASTLAVSITNDKHMAGTKKEEKLKIRSEKNSKHLKPNGNDVYLPDQMFKVSNNQINQQTLLKIYSHLEDMLRISVGK